MRVIGAKDCANLRECVRVRVSYAEPLGATRCDTYVSYGEASSFKLVRVSETRCYFALYDILRIGNTNIKTLLSERAVLLKVVNWKPCDHVLSSEDFTSTSPIYSMVVTQL